MKGSGNGEGAALRVCACRAGVPPGTGREPGTQPGGDRDAVRSQRSAGRVRLGPDPWEMGSGSGAPRTPTPLAAGAHGAAPGSALPGAAPGPPAPLVPVRGRGRRGAPDPPPSPGHACHRERRAELSALRPAAVGRSSGGSERGELGGCRHLCGGAKGKLGAAGTESRLSPAGRRLL